MMNSYYKFINYKCIHNPWYIQKKKKKIKKFIFIIKKNKKKKIK